MRIDATMFGDDVYISTDKKSLKELIYFEVSFFGRQGLKNNRLVPFLNKPLAYLIGVIVGDGHLYDYRVHIASDEVTLEGAIIPCIQILGFQHIVRAQEWRGNSWKILEINSRPLVWFLRDIFKNTDRQKKASIVRIPPPIKAADIAIKTAFYEAYLMPMAASNGGGDVYCSVLPAYYCSTMLSNF